MPPSNKIIEMRAIEVVMDYERSQRRNPVDVRRDRLNYDVKSSDRIIEVKGIAKALSRSGNLRFLQSQSVQLLLTKTNFFIYIVDNLSHGTDNAGIYVLNRKEALPFLKINKPQIAFTLQIPAAERDRFRKR